MKRFISLVLAAMLLLVSTALAHPLAGGQANANVAGNWDLTINSPQGQRTLLLVIKQEGDKLTGLMKSPRGELPLDKLTVKGDDISFRTTIQFQGQEMVITYSGKAGKDSMKGDADFGGLATGTWSAVPHKEAASATSSTTTPTAPATAFNISGVWDVTVETQAGTGSPVFTFKQDGETLSGTYKGLLGEAPVKGTIKGSDVKFSFKTSYQGQEYDVTYTGKVEGKDNMKGKVRLGDLGESDWTAKRKQ